MLKFLTPWEVDEIHRRSLEVLEHVGLIVRDPGAIRVFEDAGAVVDSKKSVVKLPGRLVEEGAGKARKNFVLGGRSRKKDLDVKTGNVHVRPVTGCIHIVDSDTGMAREPTKSDAEHGAKLIDALENFSFASTYLFPKDVPNEISDIYALKIMLTHCDKHVLASPLTYATFTYLVKMAITVQGDDEFKRRPILTLIHSPTSPLEMRKDVALMLMDGARYGIPALLCSDPLWGATGPVTLAGSLVLNNAENLAANLLVQLVAPNSPIVYAVRSCPLDMRSGLPLYGSIEFAMSCVAGVQIAHHYGFPVDAAGPCTNSKALDEQTGFEKSYTGLFPALAGADFVTAGGLVDSMSVASLEQLVIDNEFYGLMRRAIRGIDISSQSLATDVITRVGPGGSFLGDRHTREFYSKEMRQTRLFDTRTRNAWKTTGGKNIVQVAKEKVVSILANHQPEPLDADLRNELEKIVAEARLRLVKN
jgi:trimethylamine--corrinoid protein Co-methyltransferase